MHVGDEDVLYVLKSKIHGHLYGVFSSHQRADEAMADWPPERQSDLIVVPLRFYE